MIPLRERLAKCNVCPNACGVDRTAGLVGRCRTDDGIVVSSASLHFGEESCLVGAGGSGTIFLTACNLTCVFCQNYEISQLDRGQRISPGELLGIMLDLQQRGAENINFVSPTHQAPQIFETVMQARQKGLRIPIVYNCGGYENPDFLKELDGLVDIYMPDFKYGRNEEAEKYSGIDDYVGYCKASLREMHRQVGDLRIGSDGIARRGLLVRHLVLPDGISGSREVIDFLASEISSNTRLNIMDQYRPMFHAESDGRLRRRVIRMVVEEARNYALSKGLALISQ
jgi:putative pyruvate formate lyase activating enzyme